MASLPSAPSNGVTQGGGRWAVYERVDLEDEQLVEFAEGVRTGQWPSGKPASVVAFKKWAGVKGSISKIKFLEGDPTGRSGCPG
jgi:hypothetical protein